MTPQEFNELNEPVIHNSVDEIFYQYKELDTVELTKDVEIDGVTVPKGSIGAILELSNKDAVTFIPPAYLIEFVNNDGTTLAMDWLFEDDFKLHTEFKPK